MPYNDGESGMSGMSGDVNRGPAPAPPANDNLLQENGDILLLETGDNILLEDNN